jgi:hypothetical protein
VAWRLELPVKQERQEARAMLMWIVNIARTLYLGFASDANTMIAKVVILVLVGTFTVFSFASGLAHVATSLYSTHDPSMFHHV